jgi:protein TonB
MITKREKNRFLVFRSLSFAAVLPLSVLLFSCTEKVSDQEVLIPKEILKPEAEPYIRYVFEEMPTFKGKDIMEFSKWVKERIVYPDVALPNGVQGKVFVGFTVEADGSVENVSVLRGLHKLLDEEVVRVVQSSPAWEPGLIQGVPARVRFSITVPYPPK